MRDMQSGLTEATLVEKFKLSKSQLHSLKTVFNDKTNLSNKNGSLNEKGRELSDFKRKSGARIQGKSETSLTIRSRFRMLWTIRKRRVTTKNAMS